ncbi:MAG: hypothetical protein MUP11_04550, partial [Anaerolineales bacterium]|nr:hypothetical protein [Anaerolineales bacterium]
TIGAHHYVILAGFLRKNLRLDFRFSTSNIPVWLIRVTARLKGQRVCREFGSAIQNLSAQKARQKTRLSAIAAGLDQDVPFHKLHDKKNPDNPQNKPSPAR